MEKRQGELMKANVVVFASLVIASVVVLVAGQNCQPSYKMNNNIIDNPTVASTTVLDSGCKAGIDCERDLPPIADFHCKTIVAIRSADPLEVPARANDGVCYSLKILDAVANGPSSSTTIVDETIISRNHDRTSQDSNDTRHPYVLGKVLVKLLMHDRRLIKLSSSGIEEMPIRVDNFLTVGTFPDNPTHVAPASYYHAFGTMDSTINNTDTISLNGEPVIVNDFGPGGTSSISTVDITNYIHPMTTYDLDVRLLDCGSVRESSDVYLLFQ